MKFLRELEDRDFANLADHAYKSPGVDYSADLITSKIGIVIGAFKYRILEHMDRKDTSGYQGTLYQRVDTGEIVIAHRGTESVLKDIGADAAMVLKRINPQLEDAMKLTRHATQHAADYAAENRVPTPSLMHVGHSLGGAIAQVCSYRSGLPGVTFNPYGAVSLAYGLPEGGPMVVNHVMAADVVSAASPHYGEVRMYATWDEVKAISGRLSRYDNGPEFFFDRPNALAATALRLDSHGIGNFTSHDEQGVMKESVLMRRDAEALAQEYAPMFGKYREDVLQMRSLLTRASEQTQALWQQVTATPVSPMANPVFTPLRMPSQKLDAQTIEGTLHALRPAAPEPAPRPAPLAYRDAAHPDHALYRHLRQALPAGFSEERLAQVTLACKEERMRAEHLFTPQIHEGRLFVDSRIPGVGVTIDLRVPPPPLDQTLHQATQVEQHQQAQSQQREQERQQSVARTL